MLKTSRNYARLSKFRSATPKILAGTLLKDIRNMQASILSNGLANPLIVSPSSSRLIVIDGRKRLMALRRLKFNGDLPEHLNQIPYIEVERNRQTPEHGLTFNPVKIYRNIKDMQRNGKSISEIARVSQLPKDNIRNFLKIDNLSPRLQTRFLDQVMSMEQVLAFTALPSLDAQDELLARLGRLATEKDILSAIKRGETVLPVSNDNIIFIPSRHSAHTIGSRWD